jgi:DNA-binding ferritin-like protein
MTDNEKTTDALSRLLADSYLLYFWNVKGPMFTTLHISYS